MRTIYIVACAAEDAGGGVYRCTLSDGGVIEGQTYLPCDRPMFAVAGADAIHVLLRAPFTSADGTSPLARRSPRFPEETTYSGYLRCDRALRAPSDVSSTLGVVACHLTVEGEDVYVANYVSGNIVKNGSVVRIHGGTGVSLPRQDAPHTHFVTLSPDRRYVLCCDLGLDTVFVYDRELRDVSSARVPDGYGVRHGVFSCDGRYFYAVNELRPSVSAFAYGEGHLTYLSTEALPCAVPTATAAAIKMDEEGRLYVSVRGEDAIFVLDAREGALRCLVSYPSGGGSPRDIAIVGRYLLCANETTNVVTVLDREGRRVVSATTFAHPLCIFEERKEYEL